MKKTIAILTLILFTGLVLCQVTLAGGVMDKINAEKKLKVGVAPWKNFIMFTINNHKNIRKE